MNNGSAAGDSGTGDQDRRQGEMRMILMSRRAVLATMLAVAGLPAAALAQGATQQRPARAPSPGSARSPVGRIEIRQSQAAFLGSVSWGSGTLTFQGRRVGLRVRGLGIGGVGYATMTATGEVHHLTRIEDIAGSYAQARAGAVVGTRQIQGGLWLENAQGVQIHLVPQRRGVALQLGADAMVIELR
jgi:hypothetical protein